MKLFDQNICRLTYTHIEYSDVYKLYELQMKKYFPIEIPHYIAINTFNNEIDNSTNQLIYEDKFQYPKRLYTCLEQLDMYDYIFFDHEDMFLYDKPEYNTLEEYYTLIKSGILDHIRLIKGGNCEFSIMKDSPSLYKINLKSEWIFSIQPSFWKRTKLMEILKSNLNVNIWDLEVKSQKVIKSMKLNVAFSYKGGKKRGIYHFDNEIYPYIATAIGKGKWNLGEYGQELEPLLKELNINPVIRGWF